MTLGHCAVNIYCMPKPPNEDARQLLLRAAAEEFARHGLQGARVHEIVARAGVNERMIYHHFGSKEGLYRAVLEEHWLGGATTWEPTLHEAAALGAREGMRLVLGRLFELMLGERPLFMRLALQEVLNDWGGVPSASVAEVPSGLREMYARGQREGVFRGDCDFEVFYLSALGALTGITIIGPRFVDFRERAERDPEYVARVRSRALDVVLDGVTVA